MSVKLYRTYLLPSDKTVHGMKDVIKSYFDSKLNTSVSIMPCGECSYLIKVETRFKKLAMGTEVKITISLFQKNSIVEVHYLEETNNLIKTLRGIFLSPWGLGLCELYGVASRRDIPLMINEIIQIYFKE